MPRNPHCQLCPRSSVATTVCMAGVGSPQPTVLFVLDTPNRSADFRGHVLDQDLYKWMKQICDLVGLRPGVDTYVTYAVKCGGANNGKPKAKEVKACVPYLIEEIKQLRPQFVIAMGAAAIKALYGKGAPTLKHVRNRITPLGKHTKMSATFSPRIMAESPQMITAIVEDIQQIMGLERFEGVKRDYTNDVTKIPQELPTYIGFDIETEGFIPYDKSKRILTRAIATGPGQGFGIAAGHPQSTVHTLPTALGSAFDDPTKVLVGHNIKFDFLWETVKRGRPVEAQMFDTKVANSLLDENAPDNTLKYLANKFTDLGHYGDSVDRTDLANAPLDEVLAYNTRDSDAGLRLRPVLAAAMEEEGLTPLFDLMMKVEKTLVDVEAVGMWVDRPWAKRVAHQTYDAMKVAEEEIYSMAGKEINLNSPDQVAWFIYEHMGLPVLETTPTGAPSTNKEALVELKYHEGQSPAQLKSTAALASHRKNSKLWVTYFVPLPAYLAYDRRVHTTYNLGKGAGEDGEDGGTRTGRLSSKNPNLQNIPIGTDMRGMFAATNVSEGGPESDWEFCGADYSQLELRVGAFVSQEPTMLQAFDEGKDLHTVELARLTDNTYEDIIAIIEDKKHPQYYEYAKQKRVAVKRVQFGVFYGIQYRKLTKQLKAFDVVMPDYEVKAFMEKWFAGKPMVAKWIRETEDEAIRTGQVRNPLGRVRHLIGASRHTAIGMRLLRQGVNMPIQSMASEICLIAMYLLNEKFKELNRKHGRSVIRLLLQVHDMLGTEFDKTVLTRDAVMQMKQDIMEKAVPTYLKDYFGINWNVPLAVDIDCGPRWS
jgi:uracil-DNA glycosylase family 4